MNGFVRQHRGAVFGSVALHLAIAAAFGFGIRYTPARAVAVSGREPIEAVLIDERALEREIARRDEAIEAEQRRLEAEAQERERQRVEAERQERERVEREAREEVQRLQAEREREEAERRAAEEAERRAREEREREAREEAERQAREAEQRAREEAERLASEEAARQRRLEEELLRELAAEDERRQLQNSAEMDAYQRALEIRLSNNWIQPAVVPADLSCRVQIRQSALGTVEEVTFLDCNGDEAVRQSIDRAARRASPLPEPSDRRLFAPTFIVRFTKDF
jgi:colicin import membrane protein